MRGDAASGAASGVAERCAWRLRRRLSEGLPFRYGEARHAPQRLSHAEHQRRVHGVCTGDSASDSVRSHPSSSPLPPHLPSPPYRTVTPWG